MRNDKGQVTIIVIIGIILLVVFVVFQISFSQSKSLKTGASTGKVVDSNLELSEIQQYGDECLAKLFEIALYHEQRRSDIRTLYLDPGTSWGIDSFRHDFANEIKKKINASFSWCFDKASFERKGYVLETYDRDVSDVSINDADAVIVMDYAIKVSYKNQSTMISGFYNRIPTNFSLIFDAAEFILRSLPVIDCDAPELKKSHIKATYSTALAYFNLTYIPSGESMVFKADRHASVMPNCI